MRTIDTPLEFLELKQECMARVREYVELARRKCGVEMAAPQVLFSLQGTTAGKAYWPTNIIRFNPTLLLENPDVFVEQTAGHEVAHLVAHWLHSNDRIDPHGQEWKRVMGAFQLSATRCHNYDTSNVPTKATSVRRIAVPEVRNKEGVTRQYGMGKTTQFD